MWLSTHHKITKDTDAVAATVLSHVLKHADSDAKTQNIKNWVSSVMHTHPEMRVETYDAQRHKYINKDRPTRPHTLLLTHRTRQRNKSTKQRHINYN